MKCCSNFIELGCFDVCEDLKTGILATIQGLHTLELKFMSITLKKQVTLNVGQEIVLPKIFLNENSELILNVKLPSGVYMDNSYSLKTKPCILI